MPLHFQLFFGRHFNPLVDYSADPPRERLSESDLKKMNERMIKDVFPMLHERVKAKRGDMVRRLAKRLVLTSFAKAPLLCYGVVAQMVHLLFPRPNPFGTVPI